MNENKINEYDYIINAFTRDGDYTNLEVNNLKVGCITSKDNNFEIDSNGMLTIKNFKEVVLNSLYPVGSIYISANDTNPENIFGGTWEQIKDKFLLSSGDTYKLGNTGGEATHTLTQDEIPAHSHGASTDIAGNHRHTYDGWWTTDGKGTEACACVARGQSGDEPEYGTFSAAGNHSHVVTIEQTGGSQSHNNMPPYLVVNMWKRLS